MRAFYETRTGFDFSEPAWVLLADVEPRSQWQYPLAVLVLFGVALLNVYLLVRKLRAGAKK